MLEKINRKRVAGWSPQQLSSTLLGRCASPPPKPWAGRGLQTKRIVWCREGSMVLVRFRDGANKIQRKQIVRYHLFPFSQLLFPSPAQPLLPSLLPPLACRSHETDMFCDLTTVTATRPCPSPSPSSSPRGRLHVLPSAPPSPSVKGARYFPNSPW